MIAIPGLIQDAQSQINNLQTQRDKLSIFNIDDWGAINSIRNQMNALENYIDDLKDYKQEWDDYKEELNEY